MRADERVKKHLLRHVGHLVTAGDSVMDGRTRHWCVPVLARTPNGIVPIGEFELDEELNFVVAPTKQELVAVLRAQLAEPLTLVRESPDEV